MLDTFGDIFYRGAYFTENYEVGNLSTRQLAPGIYSGFLLQDLSKTNDDYRRRTFDPYRS